MSVLDEIAAERRRQDEQWGGADHDDQHSLDTWSDIISKHERELRDFLYVADEKNARRKAIVLAALAVALVESLDRCSLDSATPADPVRSKETDGPAPYQPNRDHGGA